MDGGSVDVAGYLARLGVAHPGPPSVVGLHALHRAHVERVPYETLRIHLDSPTTVDPAESAARVVAGEGGYCFHLNGAFSALLAALGYDVRWHVAGVQPHGVPEPVGASGDHLALTVHGLPGGDWLVDVGLGDGLYEPLPLRPGRYRQGPFAYALAPSSVIPGGWRFAHDPSGGFLGMDFGMPLAGPADLAANHRRLSTDPESGFVRVFTAQRRRADAVDVLRGCAFSTLSAAGRSRREVTGRGEWLALLAEVFGLRPAPAEADRLWRRVGAAHRAWLAARREEA
ncbi:arylamine N-acetyltransferase family protein [Rhizomonospora bruguierae]|uniref:arylamine N-acetyltransferase family protein n=1 Tax=Rhizomonospora bruguierae TaxID=1581705 RepID=UPI001BCB09EF|nr:arylamine N-acetyltransferase [Micromonospora sp. NBRC 107566]